MGEDADPEARLRLRLLFGPGAMFGPGKADLLEAIGRSGSIAAAGRSMSMSYRRAWSLVETMNGLFDGPLVIRDRGGSGGGGARLTPLGEEVLARYRKLEALTSEAGAEEIAALQSRLAGPD